MIYIWLSKLQHRSNPGHQTYFWYIKLYWNSYFHSFLWQQNWGGPYGPQNLKKKNHQNLKYVLSSFLQSLLISDLKNNKQWTCVNGSLNKQTNKINLFTPKASKALICSKGIQQWSVFSIGNVILVRMPCKRSKEINCTDHLPLDFSLITSIYST